MCLCVLFVRITSREGQQTLSTPRKASKAWRKKWWNEPPLYEHSQSYEDSKPRGEIFMGVPSGGVGNESVGALVKNLG
jgi:hypothetical protein